MRYFQNFPSVVYRTSEIVNGIPQLTDRIVPNMTVRFKPFFENFSFIPYTVQDRDRPDTVAAKFYGSSEYTWVVLLSNEMNSLYDWPMSSREFADYMNAKYESAPGANDGIAEAQATIYEYRWIHPITGQKLVVDKTYYNSLAAAGRSSEQESPPITVYDHELELNDKRHTIKILTEEVFASFVRQFQQFVSVG